MPKKFYSERDIEDLFKQGVRSLEISDQVVLTELAFEKAKQLGMSLIGEASDNHPSAPHRPYITNPIQPKKAAPAQPTTPTPPVATFAAPQNGPSPTPNVNSDLSQRIRSSVIAKLGNQVDATLLDTIITRVLTSTGLK